MLLTDWTADADALLPETVALRRAIHTEPEVGLHLPKTTARIKAELAGLPLEFREGPSTTGLIAVLKGAANGRTVLLRGDMDALPMTENTGLDYASQTDGAMHACGHDAHVAMLVSAAKVLCAKRERLAGTVLFMFQPGEEGWHGARHMLDDGLIDPLPDAAFALHMSPNMQAGVFAGRAGPLLASSDKLRITVNGRGGHASMPHDALDPIPVACAIVGAIQTFITRNISVFDPAVVTFGRIEAGSTDNVIPAEAKMWGTLRTLSERTRDAMHAGLRTLVEHTALAYGATAEIDIETGFPVTVCDSRAAAFAQSTVQDVFGADAWATMPTPMMGAEDFAYVLQRAPGAMMFLGAAPVATGWHSCCGLHSNRMTIDDSVLARGVALHCALAERYLAEGFGA
jgi:hippurate hydrolase